MAYRTSRAPTDELAPRAQRVVLLTNRSLLAAGVRRLLEEAHRVELSVVAADDPDASTKLRELGPDVIVVDSGDGALGIVGIVGLLEEHPAVRVVALNAHRNDIQVFGMERLLLSNVAGLLRVVGGRRALSWQT